MVHFPSFGGWKGSWLQILTRTAQVMDGLWVLDEGQRCTYQTLWGSPSGREAESRGRSNEEQKQISCQLAPGRHIHFPEPFAPCPSPTTLVSISLETGKAERALASIEGQEGLNRGFQVRKPLFSSVYFLLNIIYSPPVSPGSRQQPPTPPQSDENKKACSLITTWSSH